MSAIHPKDADEVQTIVRESTKVLPRGAGTKETLSSTVDDGVTIVEMTGLDGVLEYEPGEYTITALAGPLRPAATVPPSVAPRSTRSGSNGIH